MKVLIPVILWIVCGVIAAGIGNANFRDSYSSIRNNDKAARKECAFQLGWGLFGGPVSLTVAFFTSGFAQSGWTLSCKKEIQYD